MVATMFEPSPFYTSPKLLIGHLKLGGQLHTRLGLEYYMAVDILIYQSRLLHDDP